MQINRALIVIAAMQHCLFASGNSTVSTKESRDENGRLYTVTNTSAAKLTGLMVKSVRRPASETHDLETRYFYDSLLNPMQKPLETGQSYTFHVGSDTGELHPMLLSVEAAIFADGTALGEPSAIKSLWERRAWLVSEFDEVFHLIDCCNADKLDNRYELIKSLEELKQKRLAGTRMSIEEKHAVVAAYNTVIGNLQSDQRYPPQQILSKVREREAARKQAVHDQLAPPEIRLAE